MASTARWFSAFVLAALIAGTSAAAPAQDKPQGGPDPVLAAVLQKLDDNPAAPQQYSAKIALRVKLKVFPFISLTLRGSSFYKRPGLYRFAFRGVPKAADNFQNIAYDLGNPSVWAEKYEIALVSAPAPAQDAVVRLVPKKHGLVKALDVSIDAQTGHMNKAVWSRYDGGVITLVQKYVPVGDKQIVAHQEATISIPHMKAQLFADYTDFALDAGAVDAF